MRTLQIPSRALRGLVLASFAGLGAAGLVSLAGAPADAGTAAGPVEAVFENARAADEFLLVTTQPDGELHMTFTVPAGSKLNLTANPDDTVAEDAAGLDFRLCDPAGDDLGIAGGPNDKSKPEKDKIKWKNVPLEAFGTYTLIATAGTPGGMKAKLAITPATGKFLDESVTLERIVTTRTPSEGVKWVVTTCGFQRFRQPFLDNR